MSSCRYIYVITPARELRENFHKIARLTALPPRRWYSRPNIFSGRRSLTTKKDTKRFGDTVEISVIYYLEERVLT
jgi:hypothetical protein